MRIRRRQRSSPALSVSRALGMKATLDEGSTDSNIADQPGDPGRDDRRRRRGDRARTRSTEEFDTTNSWQGTARALLLALALAR